jgi:xanthine dehydrogenase accessory factor
MTVFETADGLIEDGKSLAMISVVDKDGSAPREVGARMLVGPEETHGTVGGGTVEALACEDARAVLRGEESPGLRTYELEPEGNTGMVCGGEMTVFVDHLQGRKRLYVAGGGHIAVPVAEMGRELGYEVTVVDDREAYADDDRFDGATVIHGDYREELSGLPMTDRTAVVVATRSGAYDRRAVLAALEGGAGYVGLIASDDKAAYVLDGLREEGFAEPDLLGVNAPAGVELGGDGPEDIALSVLSEAHREFNDTSGEKLTRLNPDDLAVVRGGGDNASGVIYRLHEAGYPVVVTEIENPTVQRLEVAYATAMFEGEVGVEDTTARRVDDLGAAAAALRAGEIPVLADPQASIVDELDVAVLVDGIMSKGKHDTGTRRDDADVVVGLGPGFEAGDDVDAVVETDRGPDLGRVYYRGTTSDYTGVPPDFGGGYTTERLFSAPTDGTWEPAVEIGETVTEGDVLGTVGDESVIAEMDGLVRGVAYDGLDVDEGLKLGDLDPRENVDPTKISDKALALGGSVLTAVQKLS